MTNREWLLNKMQNMSDEEFRDSIKQDCNMCIWNGNCVKLRLV